MVFIIFYITTSIFFFTYKGATPPSQLVDYEFNQETFIFKNIEYGEFYTKIEYETTYSNLTCDTKGFDSNKKIPCDVNSEEDYLLIENGQKQENELIQLKIMSDEEKINFPIPLMIGGSDV